MADLLQAIKARRTRGKPKAKLAYEEEEEEEEAEEIPSTPVVQPIRKRKRKSSTTEPESPSEPASDEEDEEEDVRVEESYVDTNGLRPLISVKRVRAVFHRNEFSQVDPRAFGVIDKYLKGELRGISLSSRYLAALHGRSVPNKEDAINAIQGRGRFPSVVTG